MCRQLEDALLAFISRRTVPFLIIRTHVSHPELSTIFISRLRSAFTTIRRRDDIKVVSLMGKKIVSSRFFAVSKRGITIDYADAASPHHLGGNLPLFPASFWSDCLLSYFCNQKKPVLLNHNNIRGGHEIHKVTAPSQLLTGVQV